VNPEFPIFIPSKGRYNSCYTMRALEYLGVPYKAVVEPQEYKYYVAALGENNVLELPHRDKGLVVTRNWIWDYAEAMGTEWFWTFDDNIKSFHRWNHNRIIDVADGTILKCIEDFTRRYSNVIISGMQYYMFTVRKSLRPAFSQNARVYSNMFIKTNATNPEGKKYRNEGYYNDDTDLNLRIMKDGNCTILFNAFVVQKLPTMTVSGGIEYERSENKEEDSRWIASEELRQKHPDVTEVTRKFGRWHHHVDYSSFRGNPLKKVEGLEVPKGINNYGMKLVRVDPEQEKIKPPEIIKPFVVKEPDEEVEIFGHEYENGETPESVADEIVHETLEEEAAFAKAYVEAEDAQGDLFGGML